MSLILEASHISKSFKTDFYKKPVKVLNDMSFQIHKGEFVGLIGPNGAGKTTTIKCLLNFIFPDSGKITFENNLDQLSWKKKLGYLPERPYFQEFLTGLEFLELHWNLAGQKKSDFIKRADDVLKMVNLEHAKNKKLKDYSKGMLQRIGIAQAIIAHPSFLILDEPMSGLDPDGRILIKDILKKLKQDQLSVLMSSHLLEDIEELCEKIIIIHAGEILFSGLISDFKKNYKNLEEAYRAFKKDLIGNQS